MDLQFWDLIKMKVYTKQIKINTKEKIQFVNITEQVKQAVKESGVQDGIVLVNPMHVTASVFINDNESGLLQDFKEWLEKLAPMEKDYHHHKTGENNGFAHLWRAIMGRECVVSICNYEFDFGHWETIFYGEFDGQREKRILVKVVGE